jgi:D-alanine-D-alanine ligase
VAVLRGGPSSEYDVSLATGQSVLRHLDEDTYHTLDVLITRDGVWHLRGMPVEPKRVAQQSDVVFNALHGAYGEDGGVQKVLESLHIPYTGSRALPSAAAMHKAVAKNYLNAHGVKSPHHVVFPVSHDMHERIVELFRTFPQPSVIKPVNAGSSVGVTVARNFTEFESGIVSAFQHASTLLIEEYIAGREATCGVIDAFRGEDTYVLFPIEIVPAKKDAFFDYHAKYSGTTDEICPGRFSAAEKEEIQRIARFAHQSLGLRHYSRSDFIVSPRGVYFLEVNTLPGLTEQSLVPKALAAHGASLPEFLKHVINLAVTGQ